MKKGELVQKQIRQTMQHIFSLIQEDETLNQAYNAQKNGEQDHSSVEGQLVHMASQLEEYLNTRF